jgi:hypothetical protein
MWNNLTLFSSGILPGRAVCMDFAPWSGSMTRYSGQYSQALTTQDLRPSRTMEMKARCTVWFSWFGQVRDLRFSFPMNYGIPFLKKRNKAYAWFFPGR